MMKVFRVIVAGSREFNNYKLLQDKLDNLLVHKVKTHKIVIVSGGARGADQLGERYATQQNYCCDEYPADWQQYGKSAGYKRNVQMAENADALVAFWDGQSRGTQHMISIAKEHKLIVRIIKFD